MRQPRIFLTCSRAERSFADKLSSFLRRAYDEVWFDADRYGGDAWWDNILWNIKACDIFIYLVTPASLHASYCKAEYMEALRLRKQILLLIVRAQTPIPHDMETLQRVDVSKGLTAEKVSETLAALKSMEGRLLKAQTPLSPQPIAVPPIEDDPPRRVGTRWAILPVIVGAIFLALIVSLRSSGTSLPPLPTRTLTVPTETVAPSATSTPISPTATLIPSITPTHNATPTATATWTASPTPSKTFTPTVTPTQPTSTSTVPPTVTRRAAATQPGK